MGSVLKVGIGHVSLIQIPVHDGRLAPVVVPNLFPDIACFATECYEPILVCLPQRNVLDRVPEVAAQILIAKKAPVFVRSKKLVATVWGRCGHNLLCSHRNERWRDEQNDGCCTKRL